jgi:hypothetical protein
MLLSCIHSVLRDRVDVLHFQVDTTTYVAHEMNVANAPFDWEQTHARPILAQSGK